ncbi:T9SS type A sorting domain-containing protein [Hymenobacter sp. M29]|uniref:T9SS type A sorting domain-containing protein n=1 Tax=Hymenobacter mellowenesis TaxID=3063995 RepID=A0ABT9A9Y2_9BACT|nr:T9SS type A sorting domain-containing protein [Hymenobacter sp. M29]MDO7846363.1 T9SS type A sorting domain-containing protein [Hymenobacter sp. M29]
MLKHLSTFLLAYCGTLLASAPAFAQGAIDPTFAPTVLKTAQASIIGAYTTRTMLQQPDAKILVGGNYEYIDNQRASRLRRLNADGTPDAAFAAQTGTGPDASGNPTALALQSTNKILVGCATNATYNSVLTGNLVRLNPNGSVDATFNRGGSGFVVYGWDALALNFANNIRSLAVQPDDKILVGGNLDHYNGQAVANLLRLNADGSYDTSFNVGSLGFTSANSTGTPNSGTPEVMLVQPDGKIVVGGNFVQVNGLVANNLVRLNADGSRDNTFLSTGTNATVRALARQPDGKLLVGGYFTQVNGQASGGLVRLNADGTRDASFTPTVLSPVATATGIYKIRLRADGSMVVCGTFTACNGTARGNIARLSATGVVDAGFGPAAATTSTSTPNIVYDLVDLTSGQTLAGGTFTSIGGVPRTGLALLNGTATQVDAAFNPLIEYGGTLSSATPLNNGDIILTGNYTSINGTTLANRYYPQRLNSSGAYVGQVSINPGAYPFSGYDVLPQPDGRFYVRGYTSIATAPYTGITVLRLLASGALDTGFAPVSFAYAPNTQFAWQLVALPSGGVLFAGDFVAVNGQARPGLARVSAAGVLDAGFNPTGAPWQTATASGFYVAGVQPGGQPVVSWGDANLPFLVRLSATTGQVDNTFSIGSGASSSAGLRVYWGAQVATGGQIIINGQFTSFNGQAAPNGIARLLPNGQPDPTFTAALSCRVLQVQPDGRILGSLADTSYFAPPLFQLVRLNADGSRDATFAPVTVPQEIVYYPARVTLQPLDGKILVSGGFTSINGQLRSSLVRLDNTLLATRPAFASTPELDVFPNPAQQQATLRLPAGTASATALPVTLLDVQGRVVRRFTLPAHHTEIVLSLADVAPGVYVLQASTNAGPVRQRVVVAH